MLWEQSGLIYVRVIIARRRADEALMKADYLAYLKGLRVEQ